LLAISGTCLSGYWLHAKAIKFPLLRLKLIRIRTLRASILGSFLTRLGAGGLPFLLPLLYQVGLGYSPLQSGFLIMPQPLAAISFKFFMPSILARFGYRRVLLANTVAMGLLIALFSTINAETPVWVIVIQACFFGFFSSLQYTSMNTLAYADVEDADTSMASTIVSTMQQMSISFGVAMASLATTFFIADHLHADPTAIVAGLHKAFFVLGALTIMSAFIFIKLKNDDGEVMSHKPAAVMH
jgi:MFS family permease